MTQMLECHGCGAQVPCYGGSAPGIICPRCFKTVLVAAQQPVAYGAGARRDANGGGLARPVEIVGHCANPRCAAPILASHPARSCPVCRAALPGYILARLPAARTRRSEEPSSFGDVWAAISFMLFGIGVALSAMTLICLRRDSSGHLVVIHHVSRGGMVSNSLESMLMAVAVFFGLSFVFFLIWLAYRAFRS